MANTFGQQVDSATPPPVDYHGKVHVTTGAWHDVVAIPVPEDGAVTIIACALALASSGSRSHLYQRARYTRGGLGIPGGTNDNVIDAPSTTAGTWTFAGFASGHVKLQFLPDAALFGGGDTFDVTATATVLTLP